MSLRLVPSTSSASTSTVSVSSTSNSLGTHDTLVHGVRSLAVDVGPKHPLEHRLEKWTETQETLDLTLQRHQFGLHAPLRASMERDIVSFSTLPAQQAFGALKAPSGWQRDILTGMDTTLLPKDIFLGSEDSSTAAQMQDFHRAMEKKLKM